MKKHLPVNGKATAASRLKIGATNGFNGLLVKGLGMLFLLCGITQVVRAQAPTISYGGPKSFVANSPISPVTPTASGVAAPGFNATGIALATGTPQVFRLAVNKAGDVFFVTAAGESIMKIPHGSTTAVVVGTNFNDGINNIALDVDGNVYVAFNNSSTIKKLIPGGAVTVVSNIQYPNYFAFDKAGNIYVLTIQPNVIQKIPADGGPRVTLSFANPVDVTGDAYGHVYVRDGATLKQIPEGGGPAISLATVNSYTADWLAVDPSGAIYQIINFFPDGSSYTINKITIGGSTTPVPVATGTGYAWGIATDASGNLFVTENGNKLIRQFTPKGGYYIDPYLPAGLKFNDTTGVISGTPTTVSPATDYTVSAYNSSGKSTAVLNIAVTRDSASLKSLTTDPITFSPQFSPDITNYTATATNDISSIHITAEALFSTSHVAVNGVTTTGSASANVPIVVGANTIQITVSDPHNTRSRTFTLNVNRSPAPSISYASPQAYTIGRAIPALTPVSSGINSLGYTLTPDSIPANAKNLSLNVDKFGNIYTSAVGSPGDVLKYPVGGGTPVVVGNGLHVAVDRDGNVYTGENNIVKMSPAGGGAPVILAAGYDFVGSLMLAVDTSKNVYVYDIGGGELVKIPAGNGTPFLLARAPSGSGEVIEGITADAAGNVYFIDETNQGVIYKVNANGGSFTAIDTITPNESTGINIAADIAGNVFYTTTTTNTIIGLFKNGARVKIADIINPVGVAVDNAGNIYVTNQGNAIKIIKRTGGYFIDKVLPAGLSFNNTTGIISGTPRAASPATDYAITAYNANGSATYNLNIKVDPSLTDYSSPQVYKALEPITPLTPSGNVVSAPAYSQTTIASGLNTPNHIAVDATGNIYTTGSDGFYRYPAGGGAKVHLPPFDRIGTTEGDASLINHIVGLTINAFSQPVISFYNDEDGSNFYQLSSSDQLVGVAGGFSSTGLAANNNGIYFTQGTLLLRVVNFSGAGFVATSPRALQELFLDAAGNFYATADNVIIKFAAAGGVPIVIDRGLGHLSGIAVDASGNIYVGDAGNHSVRMIPADGSALITIATGVTNPSVAVDNAGNVYIADSGTNTIQKFQRTGGYFVSPQLPDGLNIDLSTGIISGTPTTVSAATNYTITTYGALQGATLVNIKVVPPALPTLNYSTPNTYVTAAAITPLIPASDKVAAVGYKSSPNTFASALTTGLFHPGTLAVDKAGNIYVADSDSHIIRKIPVGGGSSVTVASGFGFVTGIAVDTAGNLFVGDGQPRKIYKYPAGGGARINIASGFQSIQGMAVDQSGNLYVGDPVIGEVKKIDHIGGVPVVIGSGLGISSIAVDNSGNVYVMDGLSELVELPVNGGPPVALARDNVASFVATDASGYVYYLMQNADNTAVIAKKFLPGNSNNPSIIENISIQSQGGFVVDAMGRMYVTERIKNTIDQYVPSGGYYINQPLPTGLNFDSNTGAISGTPTAVSPATNYTVTAYNVTGTAASTFSIRTVLPDSSLLANLSISAGKLSPDFVQTTTGYTAKVLNNQTSITINATADFADAQITLNGVTTAGTATGTVPLNQGQNVVNTVVTSPGGGTTKTYSVTITRLPPPTVNANLDGLSLSNSAISPAFSQTTANYTATVSYQTTSTTITPVTRSATAVMTVNDMPATSGAPVNVALTPGPNYIKTIITAADGTVKTYMVILTRTPASKNANLSSLSVNKGSLLPVFTPATTDYSDTVEATVTSVRITPATADVNATVTVNGVTQPSGTASAAIPVQVGDNSINTVVTAEDGKTIRTYSVTVNRRPTANANLDNLILSAGTLSPAFDPKTATYTASEPVNTYFITLTPIARSSTSTITVNGHTVVSGNASPQLGLHPGDNYLKTIVKAADGTIKTYMVIVSEPYPSTNAFLSNLTISAGTFNYPFSRNITGYRDTVPNNVSSVTVTPTLEDPTATMVVNSIPLASGATSQARPLIPGYNQIIIYTTAQNGSHLAYEIIVYRKYSSDAGLSNLSTNVRILSPAFNTDTTSYTESVSSSVNTIRVIATANQPASGITINNYAVASGSESPDIHLTTGNNTIHIDVRAPDRTTFKTYTIIVNKAQSSDANLTNLTIYSSTLSPSFSATTTSYTATISSALTVLHVTPTTSDATAMVTVNGTTVPSGTASAGLPMAAGANTITTVVTAQDGTVKTYTLIVTRPPSSNANLDGLAINHGTLSPVFSTGTTAYDVAISNSTTTVKVTPTASSDGATITVNGTTIASGDISADINMDPGYNLIAVKVTAEDGTVRTYNITVTRAISNNANLDDLVINSGTLSPTFAPGTTAYSVAIDNSRTTIRITPTVSNTYATVTVNGTAVPSGTISSPIHMDVGFNLVAAQVTAQDGSVKTYNITITRATGPLGVINSGNTSTAFTSTPDSASTINDDITVHQGVSPNGDGVNDYLVIDGINNYPDNKLTIMDRSGAPIFEASNYDNSQKVFDGHSGKNGRLQPAGTYFYVLEYKANGVSKHKTGYVILKY